MIEMITTIVTAIMIYLNRSCKQIFKNKVIFDIFLTKIEKKTTIYSIASNVLFSEIPGN